MMVLDRFFVRLRQRLGTCQMGDGLRGCWRRPVGTWSLDSASFPLCARDAEWFMEDAADGVGTWTPRR